MNNKRAINNDMHKYLLSIVKGRSCQEVADMMNKKYKTTFTKDFIQNYKCRHHIRSDYDCRFKKDHIPVVTKDVYSERMDVDGYLIIKTPSGKWERKARYIWEETNGKIPDSYKLIYLDGDRGNVDINNLAIIKRSDACVMAKFQLYSKDKDLNKLGMNLAILKSKLNEVKGKCKNENIRICKS